MKVSGFDFATSTDDPNYKAYVNLLDVMIDTLANVPNAALIIDLRKNSGGAGFLYEKLFTYLCDRPFRDSEYAYTLFDQVPFEQHLVLSSYLLANQIFSSADINPHLKLLYPRSSQGKYYWSDAKNLLVLPNERTFKGQLYLFVDEYVASAGSHLASLIKSYTNAVVIGRETSGGYYDHNGHLPFVYRLPNTG